MIRQSFKVYHWESWIVILPWRPTWNYVYSSFKFIPCILGWKHVSWAGCKFYFPTLYTTSFNPWTVDRSRGIFVFDSWYNIYVLWSGPGRMGLRWNNDSRVWKQDVSLLLWKQFRWILQICYSTTLWIYPNWSGICSWFMEMSEH